jgi:long-chain acyl-CoA synthetase
MRPSLSRLTPLHVQYFVSVPRVLNRIYQSIKAATVDAPGLKGKMARKAFADKLYNLEHHNTFRHALWDRIIFSKVSANRALSLARVLLSLTPFTSIQVRQALGGRVQIIGTGSAPISPQVLSFLKVSSSGAVNRARAGADVDRPSPGRAVLRSDGRVRRPSPRLFPSSNGRVALNRYGQTENCGTAVRCVEGDCHPNGTVGPPSAGVEIKLLDVPTMGYFSTDQPHPRGEILTRGAMVIPAYLKDEEKSRETIDDEGWLHSGDIGLIDEVGRLKIIDRIKNLVSFGLSSLGALHDAICSLSCG